MERFIKKFWGYELWFANVNEPSVNYCGKILFVEHDKWSSDFKFHYHKVKDETFCVLEGTLQLDYVGSKNENRTIYLNPFETFRVKPFMKHRFTAVTPYGCKFIETSTFHSEDDSYRCHYNTESGLWVDENL